MATMAKRNTGARKTHSAGKPATECDEQGIRADKVARGKGMVRDPNYPSPKVIQSVAKVLARKWTERKDPENAPTPAKSHLPKASCTT
jgi:hypothetical protein